VPADSQGTSLAQWQLWARRERPRPVDRGDWCKVDTSFARFDPNASLKKWKRVERLLSPRPSIDCGNKPRFQPLLIRQRDNLFQERLLFNACCAKTIDELFLESSDGSSGT